MALRSFGERNRNISDQFDEACCSRARENHVGAEALYETAEDVIDGMLVNLHEAYWRSSLAGAMNDTYLQHFDSRRGRETLSAH